MKVSHLLRNGNSNIRHPRSPAVTAIVCAIAVSVILGVLHVVGATNQPFVSADSLGTKTSPTAPAANQTNPTASVATSRSTRINGPSQTCVPADSDLPAPLSLSDSTGGLKQQVDSPTQYRIYGEDSETLRSQIRRCAPKAAGHSQAEFAGETTYQLTWKYDISDDQGICHVWNARVGIHISQTLPGWQATNDTDPGFSSQWNAFMTSLATHEDGHRAIDIEYAGRLMNDLNTFPPIACTQLAQGVKQLINTDISELEQANDNFDSTTSHGATQGAIVP